MASLKEMRNRIGSVKATQKITKAMQMVAAAKLRRAQDAARPLAAYRRDTALFRPQGSAQRFEIRPRKAKRAGKSGIPIGAHGFVIVHRQSECRDGTEVNAGMGHEPVMCAQPIVAAADRHIGIAVADLHPGKAERHRYLIGKGKMIIDQEHSGTAAWAVIVTPCI